MQNYEQQYKQEVVGFFNSRTNYDNDYTIRRALPVVELAQLQSGQKVLDVATGTGIVAIAAAQIVGDEGHVIGVDFSPGMLDQARRKIEAAGRQNIELIQADADYLDFKAESFDAILCSTAIVYLRDIPTTLRNWHRFLKPGGLIVFSCCSETSCMAPVTIRASAKHGISLLNINEPLGSPGKCRHLVETAGFHGIEVKSEQLGFYRSLENAKEWNGGWFNPRENPMFELSPEQLEKLKAEYRREVEPLATEQGVWYEHMAFFVLARK